MGFPWRWGGQRTRGQVLGDPDLGGGSGGWGEGAKLHQGCSWAT